MKFAISLAALMLITPCDAVKFPKIPAKGQNLIDLATKELDRVRPDEIRRSLLGQRCESDWDTRIVKGSPQDHCWSSGELRELSRLNRDLGRLKKDVGVVWPTSLMYNPDWIADLITEEFKDFVVQFKKPEHQAQMVKSIDYIISKVQQELTHIGLAQIESQIGAEGPSVVKDMKDAHRSQPDPKSRWYCYEKNNQEERAERDACPRDGSAPFPSLCNDHRPWKPCTPDMSRDACEQLNMLPEADRIKLDSFHNKRSMERNTKLIDCFAGQSSWAKMVKEAMPDPVALVALVKGVIKDEITTKKLIGEISGVLRDGVSDLNRMLEGEANRLKFGIQEGGLPNPEAVQAKFEEVAVAAGNQMLNDPRDPQDIEDEVNDLARDAVREAAMIQREVEKVAGDMSKIDVQNIDKTVGAAEKTLEHINVAELAKGVDVHKIMGGLTRERDFKRLVRDVQGGLREVGATKEEAEAFTTGVVSGIENFASSTINSTANQAAAQGMITQSEAVLKEVPKVVNEAPGMMKKLQDPAERQALEKQAMDMFGGLEKDLEAMIRGEASSPGGKNVILKQ